MLLVKRKARITVTIPRRLYNILLELRPLYADDAHPEGNMSAAVSDIIREWSETDSYTKKLKTLARLRYNVIIKKQIIERKLKEEMENAHPSGSDIQ